MLLGQGPQQVPKGGKAKEDFKTAGEYSRLWQALAKAGRRGYTR